MCGGGSGKVFQVHDEQGVKTMVLLFDLEEAETGRFFNGKRDCVAVATEEASIVVGVVVIRGRGLDL